MKTIKREILSCIALVCIIGVLIGGMVLKVNASYVEYQAERETAPESIHLEIESITVVDDGYLVTTADGESYRTSTIRFDNEIEGVALVLQKRIEMNEWQFFAHMFDWSNGYDEIYVISIVCESPDFEVVPE